MLFACRFFAFWLRLQDVPIIIFAALSESFYVAAPCSM